jgi:uncharacterized glyoxalase superfamily protein PhnB
MERPMADHPVMAPALYYADPRAALAFLERAFGLETTLCVTSEDGRIMHAEMAYRGKGRLIVGPAGWAEFAKSPNSLGGANTQGMHLELDDLDAHCARARAAGAVITAEPADQFYGHRTYRARDPEGHHWSFGQPVREVSNAEMETATGLKVSTRP